MPHFPEPSPANRFLADHVVRLQASLQHWTRRTLVNHAQSLEEQARQLFYVPFVVVSHDTEKEPFFNYANRCALALFEMTWDEFTRLPSRQSAASVEQEERDRLLAQVTAHGFIDRYEGIRITQSGKRFRIENAVVWNLLDSSNQPYGQAAMFDRWVFL
ncbi:MAG: MEKHLA domain-containing protein [Candidatus Competibacteraceae bacterium]|jgi:hypothetical protein|nr:MEKHLA domain-containing protein [Candidatus Competibacteraceae bacterium]